MKKRIVQIVVGVLVLLAIGLVFALFSLNSIVKKAVETVGPQLTDVEIRLGSVRLSLLSGRGRLEELFVGNPQGFKTPSAIQMGEVQIALNLRSLLSETIIIDALRIQAPEITFEGSLKGSNLSKILENLDKAAGGGAAAKPGPADGKPAKKFQVKEVSVTGGRINLSMPLLVGKPVTVPLPRIDLQDVGTANDAVSAAELGRQIMKPLLANVTKVVTDVIASGGKGVTELGDQIKDMGQGAAEKADTFRKGLKDLLKK